MQHKLKNKQFYHAQNQLTYNIKLYNCNTEHAKSYNNRLFNEQNEEKYYNKDIISEAYIQNEARALNNVQSNILLIHFKSSE